MITSASLKKITKASPATIDQLNTSQYYLWKVLHGRIVHSIKLAFQNK